MSGNQMTREELAAKVEWEGGVAEAITGYGLPPDVLPGDIPPSVRDAWTQVYNRGDDIRVIEEWLYQETEGTAAGD